MLARLRTFLAHWQDGLIWIPVTIVLLLLATYGLPLLAPNTAVDGLGFLQGYAALLFKGALATFGAWMCKRTYTQDWSDVDETRMAQSAQQGAWQLLAIDRLEWAAWIAFWYFVLSG